MGGGRLDRGGALDELVNRGEVWWYVPPDHGRRPGCILTRQAAIGVLNGVLLAPATRTVRDIPTEMPLGPADGMPPECVLSFDNLLTVPKALLVGRITSLPARRLPDLCAALDIAAGCE